MPDMERSSVDPLAGLTEAEKAEVLARYDERERARVRAEWVAEGSPEHECDPLDTYCGGCAVCGEVLNAS